MSEFGKSKLKILMIPVSASGHINPAIGLANALSSRGHQIIVATERGFAGKFKPLGYREEIYDAKPQTTEVNGVKLTPSDTWLRIVEAIGDGFRKDPYDAMEDLPRAFRKTLDMIKYADDRIEEILDTTSPDLVIYENNAWYPAVLKSKVPVVYMMVANPLRVLKGKNLPPGAFGLSLYADRSEFDRCKNRLREVMKECSLELEQFLRSKGVTDFVPGSKFTSANLNVIMYPKSLVKEYLERTTHPERWISIDHSLRNVDSKFDLPVEIQSKPGRLVYVSMGSIGCGNLDLMKTLVSFLSTAGKRYKFVVSKGFRQAEYELSENMWGEGYLPQLGILPLVDLAIIHGGNNSFIETLYFGKPMIVIPLFGDQWDNAQRAVDAKIGARFNWFKQSAEDLVSLMDTVLNDEEVIQNVQRISEEMKVSKSLEEAAELIESVVKSPKKPFVVQ